MYTCVWEFGEFMLKFNEVWSAHLLILQHGEARSYENYFNSILHNHFYLQP